MRPDPILSDDIDELKRLLGQGDAGFWRALQSRTARADTFQDVLSLSMLRKRAVAKSIVRADGARTPFKLALLGGYSLYPLREIIEHLFDDAGFDLQLFAGDFDNCRAEILDEGSPLHAFAPQAVVILPSARTCAYGGRLTDASDTIRTAAAEVAADLLSLGSQLHERVGCEVILGNFVPSGRFDPGAFRTRTLASDWSFRRLVNTELGLRAPAEVHVLDLEFLACRAGLLAVEDQRAWFQSKQPAAAGHLVAVAQEIRHLVCSLRRSVKKVLVLDLDNTLWGGVIGDDGLEGIELGDTSPRGEAFKTFQRYVASLPDRGVLLAVCSKNDHARAIEPFEKHPEMVLRLDRIVSFMANWEPKPDNIRQIASELDLGLDSLVFADDNPAEIAIVNQMCPTVGTILLGPDPADYVAQVQDSRYFEPHRITAEDQVRTGQYLQEAQRQVLRTTVADMGTYLRSLEMVGTFSELSAVDVPRVAQLINKSNQFNLTTIRRTEAEVEALSRSKQHAVFSMRLADRFGDHGLISVVVLAVRDGVMDIDTWVMSCRVLRRQVEEEIVNEIFRLARELGCTEVRGRYLPTAKNGMVRDLYQTMGFEQIDSTSGTVTYRADVRQVEPHTTAIKIARRTNGTC